MWDQYMNNGVLEEMKSQVHILCEFGLIYYKPDLRSLWNVRQIEDGFDLFLQFLDGLVGWDGLDFAFHVWSTDVTSVSGMGMIGVVLVTRLQVGFGLLLSVHDMILDIAVFFLFFNYYYL